MPLKRFSEYLDDAKKLVEKPPVENVPQYKGPISQAPPKASADKMAGGAQPGSGKPKPYASDKSAKDPNKYEKGFAHEGDKDLKYEPNTEVKKTKHGGDEIHGWLDDKSVSEWVAVTKSMSNANFIKKMQSEPKAAYGVIRETVEACAASGKNVSQLVSELKRGNLLGSLISEVCKHESAMPALVRVLSENKLFMKHLEEYGYMDADSEEGEDDIEVSDQGDSDGGDSDEDGYIGDEGEKGEEGDEGDEEGMDGIDGEDDEEGHDNDEDHEGEEHDEDDHDEEGEGEGHEDDDSALSDPRGHRAKHRHAKNALDKMGPPPSPTDMI